MSPRICRTSPPLSPARVANRWNSLLPRRPQRHDACLGFPRYNSPMNIDPLTKGINAVWDDSIVDRLTAYIRIPNKSPMFDPHWERNGHMEAAIDLMAEWCRAQPVAGMRVEVRRLPGKTPLLFIDIQGELPGNVLLYGHLDKQPEFPGWLPGFGPWEPVLRGGKLYGRGGADDGYAVFSSLTAIAAFGSWS